MTERFPRCAKCGGKVLREDKELTCLNCGKIYLNNQQKAVFFDHNKADILADLKTMRMTDVAEKYQAASSTIASLLARWGAELEAPPAPETASTNGHGPPEFPPFCDSWDAMVQLEWFSIYRELVLGK